jgi:hypothetical protein
MILGMLKVAITPKMAKVIKISAIVKPRAFAGFRGGAAYHSSKSQLSIFTIVSSNPYKLK